MTARTVGRYEIIREIGRGGMARVHLARQLDIDRFAALKELGAFHVDDRGMLERFLREPRVAGSLNHPNVVTVFDFFEVDGTPFIGMEYVPGGSLRRWVGRLTLPQVGGVLEGVLAGLAHAHEAGIVHRDLKPENIMISAEGRVKVADFGIAKALGEAGATGAFKTATGSAIGTPAYMAPEQAMAQPVGPWTDLYATGVMAYELLCGSVPFTGGEPMSVLLRHCHETPPPLGSRAPAVPPALVAWVEHLMAKDRMERPESAVAAWEELEEILIGVAGPRWRREARLTGDPEPAKPLTPSPFPTGELAQSGESDWGAPAEDTPTGPPAAAAPPPAEPPAAAAPPHAAAAERRRLIPVLLGVVALAVVAGFAFVLFSGEGDDDEPPSGTGRIAPPPLPFGEPKPLGEDWMRGIAFTAFDAEALDGDAPRLAVDRIKRDGGTHVVFKPGLMADSLTASEVTVRDDEPSLEAYGRAIDTVKQAGLRVVVQPIVRVEDSYAGALEPDDPEAWFDSYTQMMEPLVDLAAEHAADLFVIGTQLNFVDEEPDRFREFIADVRADFDGQLTYAAEDPEKVETIEFWDDLDLVGMTWFGQLTEEPSNDPDEIAKGWEELVARPLKESSERLGKPALLVEAGYDSRADITVTGAFSSEEDADDDEATQAAAYTAAFETFRDQPWFRGIFWLELDARQLTGDEEVESGGISFQGKAGEETLRAWHTAR